MRKQVFLILISIITILSLSAQNIPFSADHIQNPYLYNPARTGDNDDFAYLDSSEVINVFASHRSIWLRELNAGNQNISFDMPINAHKKSYLGIGGAFYNESAHLLKRTGGFLSTAFHFSGSEKNVQTSLGVHLSYMNQNINLNAATIKHPDDNVIYDPAWNGNFFNFAVGGALLFKGDKLQNGRLKKEIGLDVSAMNFMSIGTSGNLSRYESELGLKPRLFSGVNFKLLKENKYKLSFPLRVLWTKNLPVQYSLSASYLQYFKDTTTFGLRVGLEARLSGSEYSPSNSLSAFLGLNVFENYSLTAFYEFPTSDVTNGYTLGMQLNFRFNRNKKKRHTQYKQVRTERNTISENYNPIPDNDTVSSSALNTNDSKTERNSNVSDQSDKNKIADIDNGSGKEIIRSERNSNKQSISDEKYNEHTNKNSQKESNSEVLGVNTTIKNENEDKQLERNEVSIDQKISNVEQKPEEPKQTQDEVNLSNTSKSNEKIENADNSTPLNEEKKTCWVISCGVFSKKDGAQNTLQKISPKWKNSGFYMISDHEKNSKASNLYRVFVGPFDSKNIAEIETEKIKSATSFSKAFYKEISNCSDL